VALCKWVFRGYGCLGTEAALQHPVTHDNTRQHNAKYYNAEVVLPILYSFVFFTTFRGNEATLQCIAVYCGDWQGVVVCGCVLQCVAVFFVAVG